MNLDMSVQSREEDTGMHPSYLSVNPEPRLSPGVAADNRVLMAVRKLRSQDPSCDATAFSRSFIRTMAFWKNKSEKSLIPPVSEPRNEYSRAPSSRTNYSNTSTYVASRDGDPYNSAPSSIRSSPANDGHSVPIRDKYNRNNPVGDKYTRGQGELDRDRNELFSGYNPEKSGSGGRFFDGPSPRREPPPGEEDDEDVEGIKSQTRYVKQESVNSTRNALRLAREAEETARGTLGRLGDQSGMQNSCCLFST